MRFMEGNPKTGKKREKVSKHNHESQETMRTTNATTSAADTSINHCPYCSKVFFESKFVLQHLLRRHSENLLSLHNKYVSSTCLKESSGEQVTSFQKINPLEQQIKEVKHMLQILGKDILGQRTPRECVNSELISSTSEVDEIKHKSNRQKRREKQEQQYDKNISELSAKCKHSEEAVLELDKKCGYLLNTVDQFTQYKESAGKNSSINENVLQELKIYQNEISAFKNDLAKEMNILRVSLYKDIQMHCNKSEDKLSKLDEKYASEIQRVGSDFNSQLISLTSNQNSAIKLMFDQQLQSYLRSVSKSFEKTPNRRKKLIITPNTFPTKKSKKMTESNSKTPLIKMNEIKLKNGLSLNRVNTTVPKTPDPDKTRHKVLKSIGKKMQTLGISSNSIPESEYKLLSKIVKQEAKSLKERYSDFQNIRDKIEKQTNFETQKLLSHTVPKRKITFATPEVVPCATQMSKFCNLLTGKQKVSGALSKTGRDNLSCSTGTLESDTEASSNVIGIYLKHAMQADFKEKSDISETTSEADDHEVSSVSMGFNTTDSNTEADKSVDCTNIKIPDPVASESSLDLQPHFVTTPKAIAGTSKQSEFYDLRDLTILKEKLHSSCLPENLTSDNDMPSSSTSSADELEPWDGHDDSEHL